MRKLSQWIAAILAAIVVLGVGTSALAATGSASAGPTVKEHALLHHKPVLHARKVKTRAKTHAKTHKVPNHARSGQPGGGNGPGTGSGPGH
jgi:hypothetical protein